MRFPSTGVFAMSALKMFSSLHWLFSFFRNFFCIFFYFWNQYLLFMRYTFGYKYLFWLYLNQINLIEMNKVVNKEVLNSYLTFSIFDCIFYLLNQITFRGNRYWDGCYGFIVWHRPWYIWSVWTRLILYFRSLPSCTLVNNGDVLCSPLLLVITYPLNFSSN